MDESQNHYAGSKKVSSRRELIYSEKKKTEVAQSYKDKEEDRRQQHREGSIKF